jgi:hypothetical protein
MILRNVGILSTDYTALYSRRQNSSELLWYVRIVSHAHIYKYTTIEQTSLLKGKSLLTYLFTYLFTELSPS